MPAKSKWFYALMFSASAIVVMICVALAPHAKADDAKEQNAIVQAMKDVFHRPDSPLHVDPVVVEGDAAVAGWSQAEMGGRAFLRMRKGAWVIILCSGDQLKSVDTLITAGLSAPQAEKLAGKISIAERNLPASRLALFASFDGLVKVEDDSNHGHHAPHGKQHKR